MRKKGIFAGALTLGLMMFIHQPIHAHAADAVFIDENSFPDEYFRQYVSERYDLDGDGYLDEEECGNVESLIFNSDPISTFAGIEYFPNLKKIQSYNCGTSELDVSHNTALPPSPKRTNKSLVTGYDTGREDEYVLRMWKIKE